MYSFIFILLSFLKIAGGKRGACKGLPNGCCPHTKWDSEIGSCVVCPSGYYWINCRRKCDYPYYGVKCKEKCECTEEICDFKTGCTEENKTQDQISPVTSESPASMYIYNAVNKYSTGTAIRMFNNKPIKDMPNSNNDNVMKQINVNGTMNTGDRVENINIKHILLMTGTSVVVVILIAYTTVLIIDKRRKNILKEHAKQCAYETCP